MNIRPCKILKLVLFATSGLTALGFFHANGVSAQGFQDCTQMLNGASCDSIAQGTPVFKQCCLSPTNQVPQKARTQAKSDSTQSSPLLCFKALQGRSQLNSLNLDQGGKDTALVPSVKDGKKGFYLFTEDSDYFQALPSTPQDQGGPFDIYYYKVQLPHQNAQYLTYSLNRDDPTDFVTLTGAQPVDSLRRKYQNLKNLNSVDSRSREVLSQELQDSIKSVTDVYQNYLKIYDRMILMNQPYRTDLSPDPDRMMARKKVLKDQFEATLKACALKDDKNLRAVVIAEQAKLSRVNPVITGSDSPPTGPSGAAGVR